MRYATFQGEKAVADLVNRLYQLPNASKLNTALTHSPDETRALVKKAEDALRSANPALADLSRTPANTVIVVPPVDGLNHTGAVITPGAAPQATISDLRNAVTGDLTLLQVSATAQMTELTDLQNALDKDADWQKVIGEFKELKDSLPAIRAQTDQRVAGLKKMLELQTSIKQQLEEDLKGLAQVL